VLIEACARSVSSRCCATSCRRRLCDVPHAGRSGIPVQAFYDALKERGYVIYPGKLTVADSFRIGCIGRLYPITCAVRSARSAIFSARWA